MSHPYSIRSFSNDNSVSNKDIDKFLSLHKNITESYISEAKDQENVVMGNCKENEILCIIRLNLDFSLDSFERTVREISNKFNHIKKRTFGFKVDDEIRGRQWEAYLLTGKLIRLNEGKSTFKLPVQSGDQND